MNLIPDTPDAIDPAWLSAALAPRHPGVAVASVEIVERAELTNHHSLLRIRYDEAAGCPPTMFCKLLPSASPMRDAVAGTGMGPREVRFYHQLAGELSLRVPFAHVARCEAEDGAFVLLLENLAATGCTLPDGLSGVAPDAASVALEDLVALHLRFEDPTRRGAEAGWVPPPMHNPAYGRGMLKLGLSQHRERLSADFAAIAQCYIDSPDALHALWQTGPTTVIHGDPHIGNLFDDHGRTGFLDWGIISTGTPLRDVSYFLNVALSIDDRRKHERGLLRHYLELWNASAKHTIDFDEAWRTHRIHAAYTVLACCQIVTFPEDISESQRQFTDAFLARAEAAVNDLDSLSALREQGLA